MADKPNAFNQKAFGQQVHSWLKANSPQQRQPFYSFLAVVTLINLIGLAEVRLKSVWYQGTLKHSLAVYRVPLLLGVHQLEKQFNWYQVVSATNAAAIYADDDDDDDDDDADAVAAYAGYAAAAADDADAAGVADAAAYLLRDKGLLFFDTSPSNKNNRNQNRLDFINLLWLYFTQPASLSHQQLKAYQQATQAIYPQVVAGIAPLKAIGLDFLYNDLLALTHHLLYQPKDQPAVDISQQINQKKLLAYAIDLDKISPADFADPKLLYAALFGTVSYPSFVRALIVGHGGSGKTSLFQLLSGRQVAPINPSTVDFNQQRIQNCQGAWHLDKLPAAKSPQTADNSHTNNHSKNHTNNNHTNKPSTPAGDMELWDFAGQTQYFGLHQSFFHNSCLFIVVVDSRHQQSPYDWLEQISRFANQAAVASNMQANDQPAPPLAKHANQQVQRPDGNKIPVMIVVNLYENCPSQFNLQDIKHRFANLHIVGDRLFSINLSQYHNQQLSGKLVADDHALQNLLSALHGLQQQVGQQMSKASHNFGQAIQSALKRNHCISHQALTAKADLQVADFNDWVARFGLLVPVKGNQIKWVSSQWLNSQGYALLAALQAKTAEHNQGLVQNPNQQPTTIQINPPITHSHTFDELLSLTDGLKNKADLDLLIGAFQAANLVVPMDMGAGYAAVRRFIFPSALPVNDPAFLQQLLDGEHYHCYANFDVHLDFMPMGQFGQWLANLLVASNQPNSGFWLNPHHYSRHCCVLSATHGDDNATHYLLIKWHAHYRVLRFGFYYSANGKCDKQRFTQLLTAAFKQIQLSDFNNLAASKGYDVNQDICDRFIRDLPAINKKGLLYHYVMQTNNKGNTIMNNEYHAQNITNVDKNYGTTQTASTIINLNLNKQAEYLAALDELLSGYLQQINQQDNPDQQKIKVATQVVESTKQEVNTGQITEQKLSLIESFIKGVDKSMPLAHYIEKLYKLSEISGSLF